jgi:hypothetical protein
MQPRTYVLALAGSALSLFIGVAAANLLLDPLAVFGTGLVPGGLDMNARYYRFGEYEAAADRYDGLVFGSSRVTAISREELSGRMDHANFASFSVDLGQITDHLPVLEYVLKQKAARKLRLRAVFLLLDLDSFGGRPQTNASIHFLLPPPLSGESYGRFWWKNLTAIQNQAWSAALRRAWRGATAAPAPAGPPAVAPIALRTASAGPATKEAQETSIAMPAGTAQSGGGAPSRAQVAPMRAQPLVNITERLDFENQLRLLGEFVSLCRQWQVRLIVATPPISRAETANFDPADLNRASDMISRIVPLWNFTDPAGLPDDPLLWRDFSHFQPAVGQLMLDRIFGLEMPPGWGQFGRLLGSG